MIRPTITLSEARYRAPKDAAGRRGKTMDQLIESRRCHGIDLHEDAGDVVRRARDHANVSKGEAVACELDEVREARRTS